MSSIPRGSGLAQDCLTTTHKNWTWKDSSRSRAQSRLTSSCRWHLHQTEASDDSSQKLRGRFSEDTSRFFQDIDSWNVARAGECPWVPVLNRTNMFRKRHFVTTRRRLSWSTEKRPLRASLGLRAVCRDWLTRSENGCSDVNRRSARIITHGKHFGTESATQFPVISDTDWSASVFYFLTGLTSSGSENTRCNTHGGQPCMRETYCKHVDQGFLFVIVCGEGKTWHEMTWHDMRWHDMTWHAGRDMTFHDMTRR